MKRCLMLLSLIMLGSAFIGCASGDSTTGLIISGSLNSTEYSDTYQNLYLSWNVSIDEPITQVKNNLMMVQVPLKNTASVDQSFQYQFRWFTEAGVAVLPNQRPYEVVTISGRDTVYTQAIAPTPEATRWECVVRRLNPEER